MFDSNKRRFPRANYPCQITVWRDGGNDVVLANTANIGAGGLCVHLNQHLTPGDKVSIQISFDKETTPFKCSGIVRRCNQDADNRFFETGIEFEGLSEVKQAYLEGKVSELIALEKKDNK